MPYVHLNASRPLTDTEIAELRDAVAELMPLLPGKTHENTMIHITGGCAITKGDPMLPAVFVELHTYKPSPEEARKAFAAQLIAMLSEKLDVPGENIYLNIIPLDEWYSGRK